ncbi:MAG TPA: response regulator transcription factor [Ktedonobacterales bacterium]|nr:response regulator transcription factor [Ktedonobacterales bacterium]
MQAATSPITPRTLLVVEDDAALRDTIAYNLRREGYHVVTAADGVAALQLALQQPPALVLLDLMLPRLDGLDVCRQLRAKPETAHVPILMLTARGAESDKVVGLELGADDYVTKPFSWNELRARVRALLRRGEQPMAVAAVAAAGVHDQPHIMTAGELQLDEDRREVTKRGQLIALNARLFDLLAYMVRNKGTVLTRDRILEHVWGYEYDGDNRTVDVYMRWLREKLEDDASNPQLILTVRGVGYRFKG